jgi:hypothetical protein
MGRNYQQPTGRSDSGERLQHLLVLGSQLLQLTG